MFVAPNLAPVSVSMNGGDAHDSDGDAGGRNCNAGDLDSFLARMLGILALHQSFRPATA